MSKTNFLTTLKASTPNAKAKKKTNQIKAMEFNVMSVKALETFKQILLISSASRRRDTLPLY